MNKQVANQLIIPKPHKPCLSLPVFLTKKLENHFFVINFLQHDKGTTKVAPYKLGTVEAKGYRRPMCLASNTQ